MSERYKSPSPAILAWLYIVVLWLTWTPLRDVPFRILLLPEDMGWRDLIGNMVLFAPIGAVVAAGLVRADAMRRKGGRRTVVVAGVTAAVLSGIVEVGQLLVPGRNTSPYDVLMNAAGAAAAAWVVLRLMRSGISACTVTVIATSAVYAGVLVFVSATAFAGSRTTRLLLWNSDYAIVAGDELDGQRAYLGTVADPFICGGAGEDEVCLEPGAGAEARIALTETAMTSQRTRLAATILSEGAQVTDARIVTFSADALHRNATLYQAGRDLRLRLRTMAAGPNGSRVEFALPDAIPDGRPTRVAAHYERGRVTMRVDTEAESLTGRFPLGFFSAWWVVRDQPRTLTEPRHLLLAAAVAALTFSWPLGVVVTGSRRVPAPVRMAGGALLPIGIMLTLSLALKVPVAGEDIALCAAFGLAGAAVGSLQPNGRPGAPVAPVRLHRFGFSELPYFRRRAP